MERVFYILYSGLLKHHHLTCDGAVSGFELVEVDSASAAIVVLVGTVPGGGVAIAGGSLFVEQGLHELSARVVNRELDVCVVLKRESDVGRWVERIRVVLLHRGHEFNIRSVGLFATGNHGACHRAVETGCAAEFDRLQPVAVGLIDGYVGVFEAVGGLCAVVLRVDDVRVDQDLASSRSSDFPRSRL